jgi:hypothetical protein
MSRSKYDSLSTKIVRETIKSWKKDYTVSSDNFSNYNINIDTKNLRFDFNARLFFTNKTGIIVLDSTGADGRDLDENDCYQTPFIDIDININPTWLPDQWSTLYFLLCDIVRHEIEHITQEGESIHNYKDGKPYEDDSDQRNMIKMSLIPLYLYYILPKEIDANLQGLRFEGKKRRESMLTSVTRYLNNQALTPREKKQILISWRKRAIKIGGIPKF